MVCSREFVVGSSGLRLGSSRSGCFGLGVSDAGSVPPSFAIFS